MASTHARCDHVAADFGLRDRSRREKDSSNGTLANVRCSLRMFHAVVYSGEATRIAVVARASVGCSIRRRFAATYRGVRLQEARPMLPSMWRMAKGSEVGRCEGGGD